MYNDTAELSRKYERLIGHIAALGSAAVAFSGGVDSTFLLRASKEALGTSAVAITSRACIFPGRETGSAEAFCKENGIRQIVLDFEPLKVEGFAQNPEDRCYICKKALFKKLQRTAEAEGLAAVLEGSNLDDDADYRPGHRAIKELGIRSPLRETGFTKAEIRALSKQLGLPTWDKSSFACLASRFPYGEAISEEGLAMVDKAEQLLYELGFGQFRVRLHGGSMARIELLPADFERFMRDDVRTAVYGRLKELGFDYAALDIAGYRSGSMNEAIIR